MMILANVRSHSLYAVARLSVCLSSVTFVHPTVRRLKFSAMFLRHGTLTICDLSVKILRRSSQGNPSSGGGVYKGVANYSDFGLSKAISRKRCKVWAKLVLITNRKSHMSFRLIPFSTHACPAFRVSRFSALNFWFIISSRFSIYLISQFQSTSKFQHILTMSKTLSTALSFSAFLTLLQ